MMCYLCKWLFNRTFMQSMMVRLSAPNDKWDMIMRGHRVSYSWRLLWCSFETTAKRVDHS